MDYSDRRRSAKRQTLALATTVRHGQFQQASLKIEDLSFTGFSGSCDVELEVGALVSVALPPIGLVRAQIVRAQGPKIAGEFAKPVDVRKCFPEAVPDR